MTSFSYAPIAIVHCNTVHKADAPRQGRAAFHIDGEIRFEKGRGFEDALRDIERFDHLWLIAAFDRAVGWRPTVLPPRSDRRRGVFATRAPRRPNAIALSVVRLLGREGLTLHVSELDLLDGTPVLDIKPYIAWADAIPDASAGWLPRPSDPGENFDVCFSHSAREKLQFLAERDLHLRPRITDHLAVGPRPHAYRRIRTYGTGFVLAIHRWRIYFHVDQQRVDVTNIVSAEAPRDLVTGKVEAIHQAFFERFGTR